MNPLYAMAAAACVIVGIMWSRSSKPVMVILFGLAALNVWLAVT